MTVYQILSAIVIGAAAIGAVVGIILVCLEPGEE